MAHIIDLGEFEDKLLAKAVLNRTAENKEVRTDDGLPSMVDTVSPNGPEDMTIVVKSGATPTQFWEEFLIDLLTDDDGLDTFVAKNTP